MTTSYVATTDNVHSFCKDRRHGTPIVFSHRWPLRADDWDAAAEPA